MKKGFFKPNSAANVVASSSTAPSSLTSPPSSTRSGLKYKNTAFMSSSSNCFAPLSDANHYPPLAPPAVAVPSPYNFPIPQAVLAAIEGVKVGSPACGDVRLKSAASDFSAMIAPLPVQGLVTDAGSSAAVATQSAHDKVFSNFPYLLNEDVVHLGDKEKIENANNALKCTGFENLGVGLGVAATCIGNLGVTPPVVSVAANSQSSWKSLFKKKPGNAGSYTPIKFDIDLSLEAAYPPKEVVDAGKCFWKDQLVGFFLDAGHSYSLVKNHLIRAWKLKGNVKVKCDNSMYFFEFSCPEERRRILEADPIVIYGKIFVITQWSPSIDLAREQILSIPVWVKFSSIPSIYQPLIGLNWLANHIGDLICFDISTERRDRISFAKAMIEISPARALPDRIAVRLDDERIAYVDVNYLWKPEICTTCHSFGHLGDSCVHSAVPPPPKIPLPRPASRQWVPKSTSLKPIPVVTCPPALNSSKLTHLQTFLATTSNDQSPIIPTVIQSPPSPPPPPPPPIVVPVSGAMIPFPLDPFDLDEDLAEGHDYSVDEILPSHLIDPPGEIHVYGGEIDLSVDLHNLFSD